MYSFSDFDRMNLYILCLFKSFIEFIHTGYIQAPGEENLLLWGCNFSEKQVINNDYRKQSRL